MADNVQPSTVIVNPKSENIAASSASSATKSFFGGITGTLGVIVGIIVALIICCVIGFVLIGIVGNSSNTSKTGDAVKIGTNQDTTTPQVTTEAAATTFKIGDLIKVGDITLTVYAIEDNVKSTNQFSNPTDGKKWVAVDVKLTNNGNNDFYSTTSSFSLKDVNDYSYQPTYFAITKNTELKSENIAKGSSSRGWINFEASLDSSNYSLIFKPNMFLSDQAVVKLY